MHSEAQRPGGRLPRPVASALVQLVWLVRREFAVERRAAAWIGSMGMLAVQEVVILGLGFSFEGTSSTRTVFVVAALWLAFLFSGTVGANRSYALEREGGALAGVLMLAASPALVYTAKVLSGLFFLLASVAVMFGVSSVLLHLSIEGSWLGMFAVFALASFGFMALLALLGGFTSGMRGRDALLGIAALPLAVPLFYAATSATRALAQGAMVAEVTGELALLAAFDAVYFALGLLSFERLVEA